MSIGDEVFQIRHVKEVTALQRHILIVRIAQGFTGADGAIGRIKIHLSLYGTAGTGPSYRHFLDIDQVIEGSFKLSVLPERDIVILVSTSYKYRLGASHRLCDICIIGQTTGVNQQGLYRIKVSQSIDIAIVSGTTTGTQHHKVTATSARDHPLDGLVNIRATAHQYRPASRGRAYISRAPCDPDGGWRAPTRDTLWPFGESRLRVRTHLLSCLHTGEQQGG